MNNENRILNKLKSKWPLLLIFIIFIFFILPVLITKIHISTLFDFSQTGQIGDTIGGITNPIIAFIAAILTFMAFYVQYEANETQKKQFMEVRIENNVFELLKKHNENTQRILYDKVYEKWSPFKSFFHEIAVLYWNLKNFFSEKQILYDEDEFLNIVYHLFYFGLNYESKVILEERIKFQYYEEFLNFIERYSFAGYRNQSYEYQYRFDGKQNTEVVHLPTRVGLGHHDELGLYFRHLFQTIKYIDEQETFDINDKYRLAKIVRSHLGAYEQIVLFYNSFSTIGKSWIENNYIIKYQMIKNIPLSFINFGVHPETIYKSKIQFEWEENNSNKHF